MSGCPLPCALPSSSGATARGTRRSRSPSHQKSRGTSDGGTHGRWYQRPQGLATVDRSLPTAMARRPVPSPGPLLANTEGGGAPTTEQAQVNDPRCSPKQAMTPRA